VTNRVLAWLAAFVFTQVVEMPIWTYALRTRTKPDERMELWACIAVAFGASAFTHPIVWFVFPQIAPGSYWAQVAQCEAFAVLAEAAYMSFLGLPSALAWSILANGASAGLGLLSRATLGFP